MWKAGQGQLEDGQASRKLVKVGQTSVICGGFSFILGGLGHAEFKTICRGLSL